MRGIISIFTFLTLLCTAALAATIISTFDSEGDGTMMHYTYLKEPDLQESGYTSGYKAGSMNYFSNGSINYWDTVTYDDGLKPSDGNSSVNYTQSVHFEGDKGISEFYGKGFYPSNRAISAWKKIRYDDLSYNKSFGVIHLSGSSRIAGSEESSRLSGSYDLGESYDSSKIDVEASVKMGPVKGRDKEGYDFRYNATVKDGVLEIRDATGWTNRTGALRVDWERDAVMRGNFTVKNNLRGEYLFFPAEGGGDWLSCCIGGDIRRLEQANDEWPNAGTYATLAPKQVLPSEERTQNCSITYDSERGYTAECTNLSYEKFDCTEDSCPGFECIFGFGGLPIGEGEAPPLGGSSIQVEKRILSNKSDSIKYEIMVHNSGSTRLEKVTVTDRLPDYMDFKNASIIESIKSTERNMTLEEEEPYEEEEEDERDYEATAIPINTSKVSRGADVSVKPDWNLTWSIGKIEPGDSSYIYLNVFDKSGNDENVTLNMVYVEGTWIHGNETLKKSAQAIY